MGSSRAGAGGARAPEAQGWRGVPSGCPCGATGPWGGAGRCARASVPVSAAGGPAAAGLVSGRPPCAGGAGGPGSVAACATGSSGARSRGARASSPGAGARARHAGGDVFPDASDAPDLALPFLLSLFLSPHGPVGSVLLVNSPRGRRTPDRRLLGRPICRRDSRSHGSLRSVPSDT